MLARMTTSASLLLLALLCIGCAQPLQGDSSATWHETAHGSEAMDHRGHHSKRFLFKSREKSFKVTQELTEGEQKHFAGLPSQSTVEGILSNITAADLQVITGREAPILRDLPLTLPKGHTSFHWAITACDRRRQWVRSLTTTLISAMFSGTGAQPLTITIVWCKPYDASKNPSLFQNLRFSSQVRVLYHPEGLPMSVKTVYMRALMVPQYLGMPQYPLVITEDDVVFSPCFNLLLTETLRKVNSHVGGNHQQVPYLVNLYDGGAIDKQGTVLNVYNWKKRDASSVKDISLWADKHAYQFGGQGIFFSPKMTALMARHFWDLYQGTYEKVKPESKDWLQDISILEFLRDRFHCYSDNSTPQPACWQFIVRPSLVEHAGLVSGIFQEGAGNTRFHLSKDFPHVVAFPNLDPPDIW